MEPLTSTYNRSSHTWRFSRGGLHVDAWPVVATAALQCALPRARPSDSPCYQQLERSNAPHEFAVAVALALRTPDFPLVHSEVTAALVQVGATLLENNTWIEVSGVVPQSIA